MESAEEERTGVRHARQGWEDPVNAVCPLTREKESGVRTEWVSIPETCRRDIDGSWWSWEGPGSRRGLKLLDL